MANILKFKTNVTETVTFRFNQPKEFDNKFKPGKKTYSYGIDYKGDDYYMSATPILHDKIQKFAPVEGKTLEITKIEGENNRKYWDVKLYGTQDAPQSPTSHETPSTNGGVAESLETRIREAFEKRDAEIKDLRKIINNHHKRLCFLEDKDKPDYVPVAPDVVKEEISMEDIPFG